MRTAIATASSILCLCVLLSLFGCPGGPSAGTFQGNGICKSGKDLDMAALNLSETTCSQNAGVCANVCGGDVASQQNQRVLDTSGSCVCDPGATHGVGEVFVRGWEQKNNLLSKGGRGLSGPFLGGTPTALYAGCKNFRCRDGESCFFWQVDPVDCFQLGYVNGFAMAPPTPFPGGIFDVSNGRPVGHDGDEALNVCPISSGAQGAANGKDVLTGGLDTRGTTGWTFDHIENVRMSGTQDIEVAWCRWYGNPITIPADIEHSHDVTFCTMRPDEAGQRISAVGDWIVDGAGLTPEGKRDPGFHTEIHEARIIATVKPDQRSTGSCPHLNYAFFSQPDGGGFSTGIPDGPLPTVVKCDDANNPGCQSSPGSLNKDSPNKDLWHMLTNGIFVKNTAQQDRLFIRVPLPPATFAGPKALVCDVPPVIDGCMREQDVKVDCTCDHLNGTCDIEVIRNSDTILSSHDCGSDAVCPCTNRTDDWRVPTCPSVNFTSFGSDVRLVTQNGTRRTLCDPLPGQTHIAFAGDVRAEWKDPMDAWECDCDCDDPATVGGTIRARVQGCAAGSLADDEPDDIRAACAQVCPGAQICEGAPACRIASCRPAGSSTRGLKLAVDACQGLPSDQRVAPESDYRVVLNHALSVAHIGNMNDKFELEETAAPHVSGFVWLSRDRDALEFADMQALIDDFILPVGFMNLWRVDVTGATSIILSRFPGEIASGGTFTVLPGRVQLGLRAVTNGIGGGVDFLASGAFTGLFDPAHHHFVLEGRGRNTNGQGVFLHLEGSIDNHPPMAVTGPDFSVECTSPTTTSILLDAGASYDSDPGDSISYYQWFDAAADAGVSNQSTAVVRAAVGQHTYELHVYDQDLGSDMARQTIKVVDTTPPTLAVAPASVCLWPPNHAFALFTLGKELQYAVSDTCDANAEVWIDSVVSNEATVGGASGNTSPDVIVGTQAACVRSERAGVGLGRNYTVTVKARDTSCNVTTRTVQVVVPHDMSGHPGCQRAVGMDLPDVRCLDGAPTTPCVAH